MNITKSLVNTLFNLFMLLVKKDIEIVKLLRVDINKGKHAGKTPFYNACEEEHIEIVKYILACGREVDINKQVILLFNESILLPKHNKRKRKEKESKNILYFSFK